MERIMTVREVSTKINIRLNKTASGDYDNLWSYVKKEAFNKAINEWVRRQVHGKNQSQEGDEETRMRVDDLQILLSTSPFTITSKDKGIYNETAKFPKDYLYFKRLSPTVSKNNCGDVRIKSYLKEEANVDNWISFPSYSFEETFHTIIGNRIHVYHNKDFSIDKLQLTYYRKPKFYSFVNLDEEVEFKDDICEILVDEACKITASDLEILNVKTLAQERAENNN